MDQPAETEKCNLINHLTLLWSFDLLMRLAQDSPTRWQLIVAENGGESLQVGVEAAAGEERTTRLATSSTRVERRGLDAGACRLFPREQNRKHSTSPRQTTVQTQMHIATYLQECNRFF